MHVWSRFEWIECKSAHFCLQGLVLSEFEVVNIEDKEEKRREYTRRQHRNVQMNAWSEMVLHFQVPPYILGVDNTGYKPYGITSHPRSMDESHS